MIKKLMSIVVLVIALGSCKKEAIQLSPDSPEELLQVETTPPNCTKFDLVSNGGGVYTGIYEGVTFTVTNLSYLLYSNGSPLPLRDGDPAFGSMSAVAANGEAVDVQPNVPDNHFALSQATWASSVQTINRAGYHAAVSQYQQYLQGSLVLGPGVHPPSRPWLSDYMTVTQTAGAGIRLFTGKLIRSTTGNSTFAVACEGYLEPPPLTPAIPINTEPILHKVVEVGGAPRDVYISYNATTGTITDVNVFNSDCTPVAVGPLPSAHFIFFNRLTWTTSDIITITTAVGTIFITGSVQEAIIPC